jgi:MarC family membrane protein
MDTTTSFASAVVIFLLVMDPVGNIPLFGSLLRNVEGKRRAWVILRECLIAFAVLLAFMFGGATFLKLLGLSDSSLGIAGGVILLLIAIRMIFRHPDGVFGREFGGEPFIVPLAIPAIAGPTALATVLLLVSREPSRTFEWIVALTVAMVATSLMLVFAEKLAKWIGEQGLMAFERLMGLILTAIAVEMLLKGIESFVRHLHAAT